MSSNRLFLDTHHSVQHNNRCCNTTTRAIGDLAPTKVSRGQNKFQSKPEPTN